MDYILAILCVALMTFSLILLFIGLPGNWVILGLAALWNWWVGAEFGWSFFLLLIGLAALGEVIEFVAGMLGAKYFGGSKKGSWGGVIGAIVGGILCAPIMFGLGALPGALAGAFAGCYLLERAHGMANSPALSAAMGTTLGRFGGFLVKLAIGITLIALITMKMWEKL